MVKIAVVILFIFKFLYTKDKAFNLKITFFSNTTNRSKRLLQIPHTFVHKLG